MSITYVDTDQLEHMRDKMFRVLSHMEECAGTLRQMYSQMLLEDVGLSVYPQWGQAVEDCGRARQKADVLCETLDRFLTVLEGMPDGYRQMEQRHIHSIEALSVRMRTLGAGLAGVMSAEYPTGLAEGSRDSRAMNLEQQVTLSAQAMEMAALLAVTQVLKEEYAYDQVMPGALSVSKETGSPSFIVDSGNTSRREEEEEPEKKEQNTSPFLTEESARNEDGADKEHREKAESTGSIWRKGTTDSDRRAEMRKAAVESGWGTEKEKTIGVSGHGTEKAASEGSRI